jgi:hypothetical protein
LNSSSIIQKIQKKISTKHCLENASNLIIHLICCACLMLVAKRKASITIKKNKISKLVASSSL